MFYFVLFLIFGLTVGNTIAQNRSVLHSYVNRRNPDYLNKWAEWRDTRSDLARIQKESEHYEIMIEALRSRLLEKPDDAKLSFVLSQTINRKKRLAFEMAKAAQEEQELREEIEAMYADGSAKRWFSNKK